MTAGSVTLNLGTGGEDVATDEIAGVAYQRVKLVDGTIDGTEAIGGTAANGLDVDVTRVQGTVTVDGSGVTQPVSGTVTANLSATDNAVLDNIDTNTDYGQVTGGGTETGALRVTLANNSTGVLSVDDNGNSLTVDAAELTTLAGAVSGTEMQVDIVSAPTLTVDLGANNDVTIDNSSIVQNADSAAGGTDAGIATLAIRDDTLSVLTPVEGDYVPLRVNSTGALHVTGGGGGTQFNVDDVAGATDAGTLALAIRDDALTTLTPADGDYVGLRVNSTGALHVTGGGGGTEYNEDVATPATITGTATMMERDDALGTLTPIEGDWAAMRCSAEGALWVQEFNSDAILADTANIDTNVGTIAGAVSGTEMQVDIVAAPILTVDLGANNDVTIDNSSVVQAADSVAGATDAGIPPLAIRDDTLSALTPIEGDYVPLRVNSQGALHVTGSAGSTQYAEDSVHNSGDTGTMVLGVRQNTQADFGADGDYVPMSIADSGGVRVEVVGGVGGTHVDDAAFTPASDDGVPIFAMLDDTATDTVDEGDAGILRMSSRRQLHVTMETQTGDAMVDDTNDALRVNVVAGGGTGGTSETDDAAFTAGTGTGTPAMGFFSADTVDAGDVGVLAMDASRRLLVSIEADNAGIGGGTQYTEDAAAAGDPVGNASILVRADTPATITSADGDNVARRGTNYGAAYSQIVTSSGAFVDSFGGGTEYTEDAAAAANPVGGANILVRQDTPATLTSADGDNVAQRGTNYGAAFVQVVDSSGNFVNSFGGSGGTSIADDAAFTAGTTQVTPAGAMFDDTTPDSVDEGDAGILRMSANRNLYSTIRDAAGNERGVNVNASNQLTVAEANSAAILADTASMDTNLGTIAGAVAGTEMQVDIVASLPAGTNNIGDVDIASALPAGSNTIGNIGTIATSITPGTAAANLGKAEDAVHASGDTGVMALTRRIDTASSSAGTSGDYATLNTDANGRLYVNSTVSAALPAGTNNIGDVDVLTLPALPAGTNNIGDVDVLTLPALPAGTNNIGDVDVASIAAGANLVGDVGISGARTSGGTTIFRSIDLDETEEEIKATAGQVYWIHAMNLAASARYLKFYNATAATVVVGTTAPVLTFPLATQGDTNGAGFTLAIPNGIAFGTAITVAATTGIADADTGAPGANEVVVNIGYA